MSVDTDTMALVGQINAVARLAEEKVWNNKDFVRHYQLTSPNSRDLRCGSEKDATLLVKQIRMEYAGEQLGLDNNYVKNFIFEVYHEPPAKWKNWLLAMLEDIPKWKQAVRFIRYNRGDNLK